MRGVKKLRVKESGLGSNANAVSLPLEGVEVEEGQDGGSFMAAARARRGRRDSLANHPGHTNPRCPFSAPDGSWSPPITVDDARADRHVLPGVEPLYGRGLGARLERANTVWQPDPKAQLAVHILGVGSLHEFLFCATRVGGSAPFLRETPP